MVVGDAIYIPVSGDWKTAVKPMQVLAWNELDLLETVGGMSL